jgi:hypothetical protein
MLKRVPIWGSTDSKKRGVFAVGTGTKAKCSVMVERKSRSRARAAALLLIVLNAVVPIAIHLFGTG